MRSAYLPSLVLSLALALVGQPGKAAELMAGAAKIDITPPAGYAMWGYGARKDLPAVGVLDRLQARALVLRVGAESIAIVSLDLGRAPTRQSTAAIRAKTKAAAGIEHLFLVASHTHHGPVIETDHWPTPQTSYVRQLEEKLSEVIIEASKAVRPAKLGVAVKEVNRNRNRHTKKPEKPGDKELRVLRVEDLDGKPIAHAVNFAAHPVMQDAKVFKFSADYVGVLARTVEQETGAPCLFLQGAAGDQSVNAGEDRGPENFGKAMGNEVLAMAKSIACKESASPSLQVTEDDFKFRSRIQFDNPAIHGLFVAAFFKDLVEFFEKEYKDGIRPHLTTALLNGDIGFVGVSGEFFSAHSVGLKRRAGLEHVFFLGYCNDYQQYFPTIEGAAEGGYGADPQVSPVEVGAGEQIINQALIRLYRMRGKLPNLPPEKRS